MISVRKLFLKSVLMNKKQLIITPMDGLVQDCSNPIANTLEVLQSCAKPSIFRRIAAHTTHSTRSRPISKCTRFRIAGHFVWRHFGHNWPCWHGMIDNRGNLNENVSIFQTEKKTIPVDQVDNPALLATRINAGTVIIKFGSQGWGLLSQFSPFRYFPHFRYCQNKR